MKKYLILALVLAFVLSFAACQESGGGSNESDKSVFSSILSESKYESETPTIAESEQPFENSISQNESVAFSQPEVNSKETISVPKIIEESKPSAVVTAGEKKAKERAKAYLAYAPFSRESLIG